MARSNIRNFELERFIGSILGIYKRQANAKGIEFRIQDDLASYVLLNGNTKKIKFLLDTVLQNTLKFSDATRICFSTNQLLKTDKEILLEFLLEDNGKTGKGSKPFAYYRALVIAKKMIEDLHGKSELIISQGKGSTLKFIIKCSWKETNVQTDNSAIANCVSGLHSKMVLVVEDNEINQKTIIHILEKQGIGFQVASNGKEGIDVLEKMGQCDLVIMDLDMPYMDGYAAANYIRKKLKSEVPIIGMTSGEEPSQALKCLEAGMNQFIRKPFSPGQLLLQVCSFFGPEYYTLEPVEIKRQTA